MPILRMYNTIEDAMQAVTDLKQASFGRIGIQLVAKTADEISVEALTQMGVQPAQAQRFLRRVSDGGALVIAEAPFGTARGVTEVLDRSRPNDTGVSQALETRSLDSTYGGGPRDGAAPLSSALNIPVLLNDPSPLSSYLKLPTLSRRQTTTFPLRDVPRLSETPAPFSSALGMPLLSENPAPLSSAAGVKLLSEKPAPFSSLIGMRLLYTKAAPLSSLLGWKPLLRDAAPLSSLLRLKALARDPTPLSSLLGLPVLLKDKPTRP